jgi:hypothetical protein
MTTAAGNDKWDDEMLANAAEIMEQGSKAMLRGMLNELDVLIRNATQVAEMAEMLEADLAKKLKE